MKDKLKDLIEIGLGLASHAADKIEEIADNLAKEAKLSQEDGKKLYEELKKKTEGARKNFDSKLDELIDNALKRLEVARLEDLKKLEERIEKLEKRKWHDAD